MQSLWLTYFIVINLEILWFSNFLVDELQKTKKKTLNILVSAADFRPYVFPAWSNASN